MTEAIGTLCDYQVMRWRQLAERRLADITDMFDSGRWSIYYRERDFLEVIKQSKALVEIWRKLAPPEPDARLPASPFAVQAPVELPEVDPLASAKADVGATADLVAAADFSAPELEIESSAQPNDVPVAGPDFRFEDELATIALKRLRETAAMALDIARHPNAA